MADPGNAGWQRDLSVSHNKIGDVLFEQGNLPGSLESYRASLAIREHLAITDPGNVDWEHDVALSLQRVGLVVLHQGDKEAARAAYARGHEIMQRLARHLPEHADFNHDLAGFQGRLAEFGVVSADHVNRKGQKTHELSRTIAQNLDGRLGSNSADRAAPEMTGLHPEADVLARALAVALVVAWNVRFCIRPAEHPMAGDVPKSTRLEASLRHGTEQLERYALLN